MRAGMHCFLPPSTLRLPPSLRLRSPVWSGRLPVTQESVGSNPIEGARGDKAAKKADCQCVVFSHHNRYSVHVYISNQRGLVDEYAEITSRLADDVDGDGDLGGVANYRVNARRVPRGWL